MIVIKDIDQKLRMDFQLWLAQWNDIPWAENYNHSIYMKLYNVISFA